MSNEQLPLLPAYKHQVDTRSQIQITLSNKLTRCLSHLNFQRIHQQQPTSNLRVPDDLFFFVCLTGLPPFDREFQSIGLPGKKAVISFEGFDRQYSEEQYISIFRQASFDRQADRVYEQITKIPSGLKIVLVYHSFGTYIASTLFKNYRDVKISGIIDIGGAPIRFYPVLTNLVQNFMNVDEDVLLDNADFIKEKYVQSNKQIGFNLIQNKYLLIKFIKLIMSEQVKSLFEDLRHLPPVLKLFIFGQKDVLFSEEMINQKMIHYCFKKKFAAEYEGELEKAYQRLFNQSTDNVQQKFVFSFPRGKHSLHLQSSLNEDIKAAIHQYLLLLSATQL